ncbi:hypothetical protein AK812_SmicGene41926 [Symbiodinium microadriaticum]|uniref:Uncharacterized protein n=1 Tax=Symbiodinium microadriaticum TaxID=2951 RepID=A0A1Q9C4W2_SYMMI|nr:hypothetical protein AK812_SmicGene41926 [Symbiodinium microadriaticum]
MPQSCLRVENVCLVPNHNQTDVGLWHGVIAWPATKFPSRTASFLIAAPTVHDKVRTALQTSPESEGAVCARAGPASAPSCTDPSRWTGLNGRQCKMEGTLWLTCGDLAPASLQIRVAAPSSNPALHVC